MRVVLNNSRKKKDFSEIHCIIHCVFTVFYVNVKKIFIHSAQNFHSQQPRKNFSINQSNQQTLYPKNKNIEVHHVQKRNFSIKKIKIFI